MKSKLATFLVLMAASICPCFKALAQGCASSAGANSATGFSTMSFPGSGFNWSNPGNAQASDNSYATAGINLGTFASAYSDYLTIQNFGFSIPSTATICEIDVEVERSVSGLGLGGFVADQSVRLLKNGALYGNDLANPAVAWPASDGSVTYGNGLLTSTWGGTWLPSDVNSVNFGVALSASLNTGIVGLFMNGRIDRVRVTVIYDTNSLLSTGLESFTASRSSDGNGNTLAWTAGAATAGSGTTGAGTAGVRYIVQRSGNGLHWQDIATISPGESTAPRSLSATYTYTDRTPPEGASFYRIHMEDIKGYSAYSPVKEIDQVTTALRCWPNPFNDIIHIAGIQAVKSVVLKDIRGQILYRKDVAPGDWQIGTAGLPPGLYYLQVGTATYKMLKQAN